ncbi:bifunctional hydroxymethylpyrimidine kinase/phosphomethylpyrimidine kinase [Actinoalloteichus hymeniacidonis]|uniref:Hydroxymethylpyrimidine kinase/phosphomethylpyrimidine kinase n=1 Tax=Actinoalloteichus hymeniacidonis TaxID=340345 RepID=A0AAC9HL59_9PSEU|nr:bifunctional hydroxymethylpyrimidine kinase/phosphomethylpyrimidine kinase [Actinoalloteichus hymeniacidonis]AOS61249.1 hydroxymethylpyrimidine kinase/phosphomethylpyrimidine kinase [Actinoalloteichus hymeniacidonis]MBB5910748.1 hydroxymethylpyrimidine/phosphomethylpyrimidine kinase [Actinoalloteichus hymeniacidonis]
MTTDESAFTGLPVPGATPPTALTIAGSDSGGGAGIQADLKTFLACGVHGMTALTAVTVQNSRGVADFLALPPELVAAQIRSVAADIGVGAAKTGMLASAEIIEAVIDACAASSIGRDGRTPLVVDPVAASMHGDSLLARDALAALRDQLLPIATLVTPNLDEVRLLTGLDVTSRSELRKAAEAVHELGPSWVLIKAGHLTEDPECVDLLFDGSRFIELPGPRMRIPHTHGGGDTLAASITSALARQAQPIDAVRFGKRYIMRAVADAYPLGAGVGPVSAFWRVSEQPI